MTDHRVRRLKWVSLAVILILMIVMISKIALNISCPTDRGKYFKETLHLHGLILCVLINFPSLLSYNHILHKET